MTGASARRYHGRRRARRRLGALLACAALASACEPAPPAPREPPPPRIVSLGADLGRLLVELGVGAGVVGADSPSLGLPELARAVDLGSGGDLSPEDALGLRPELVLVLAAAPGPEADFASALESEGIPTHRLDPRSANEVIAAIHRVGRLVARELRAAAVAARLTHEVSRLAMRRDGQTRLIAAWVLERDPLVVVGGVGLLHELLELAGAENAFHTPERERLRVATTELVARAPDVVLGAPAVLPAVPQARRVAVAADLAALPTLDVAARLRALQAALYPQPAGP